MLKVRLPASIGRMFADPAGMALYYCSVCRCNVVDQRGWPVWDCLLCGSLPDKLEEERITEI